MNFLWFVLLPTLCAPLSYNKQQYRNVPTDLQTQYRRVPSSLFNLTDEENEIVDLETDSETCEMYNMAAITSKEECLRAAQELGYCGNVQQYFAHRNSTGHVQLRKNVGHVDKDASGTSIPHPITTAASTWKWQGQCETCDEYLNQKITGAVIQGKMFDSENCNATTARVTRTMEVGECQSSFHTDPDEAFSWEYSCDADGNVVQIIPFPEGTSDCTGRSTTFGTGVWKDLYKYDKKYSTDVWKDNFFHAVQPVIVLAHLNNPQCAADQVRERRVKGGCAVFLRYLVCGTRGTHCFFFLFFQMFC